MVAVESMAMGYHYKYIYFPALMGVRQMMRWTRDVLCWYNSRAIHDYYRGSEFIQFNILFLIQYCITPHDSPSPGVIVALGYQYEYELASTPGIKHISSTLLSFIYNLLYISVFSITS